MYCTRKLTEQVWWVGGGGRRLVLFENLFPTTRGVSYNSYLILGEQTAVVDTVDSSISRQFLENVFHTLDGRPLGCLVISHMEPDHCASIETLPLRFPTLKLAGNVKTFAFMGQFYDFPLDGCIVTVKEGGTLSLGGHILHFHMTPMVHRPEVMITYESGEKLLLPADAFGSFGATGDDLFNDELNFDRDWLDDARRYHGNTAGGYDLQVQAALKKLPGLDIAMICPLHGPIWCSDPDYPLNKYDKWSRYEPEERVVMVLYVSMYGDTENAVNLLAAGPIDSGVKNIAMYDIFSAHVFTLISEAFRCGHLVLAAPTYNNGVYPVTATFLHDMKALGLQNRTVALAGNGSWVSVSGKLMHEMLDELKGFQVLEPVASLRLTLKDSPPELPPQLRDRILDSLNG